MALNKDNADVDAWEEIAQGGFREGAIKDVSGDYVATLHINCALSSVTAHDGTEIIVLVSSKMTGDEDWTAWDRFIGPIGTACKADFAGAEAAGQTVLSITNPVTQNLDNDKKFKFVENTADATLCEIVYQLSNTGDAGDTITVLNGLTHAQTVNSDIWDIDHASTECCIEKPVTLNLDTLRVKVLYNNHYDATGSSVYTRCRLTYADAI